MANITKVDARVWGSWIKSQCIVKLTAASKADQRQINTVEVQLSGRWLSGLPNIRIGLALPVNIFLVKFNYTF